MSIEHEGYIRGPKVEREYANLDSLVTRYKEISAGTGNNETEKERRELYNNIYGHCQNFLFEMAGSFFKKKDSLLKIIGEPGELVHKFYLSGLNDCLNGWKTKEEMMSKEGPRHGNFITYLKICFRNFVFKIKRESTAQKRVPHVVEKRPSDAEDRGRFEKVSHLTGIASLDAQGNVESENSLGWAPNRVAPGAVEARAIAQIDLDKHKEKLDNLLREWIKEASMNDLEVIFVGICRFELDQCYRDLWQEAAEKYLKQPEVSKNKKKKRLTASLKKIFDLFRRDQEIELDTLKEFGTFLNVSKEMARQKEDTFVVDLEKRMSSTKKKFDL